MSKTYRISRTSEHRSFSISEPLTVEEASRFYAYTLEVGASFQHEKGASKINLKPRTINSLLSNLNKATHNSTANGYGDAIYTAELVLKENLK